MIPLIKMQLGCVTEGKVPDHDGSPVEFPIGNIQITVLFFLFFFVRKSNFVPLFKSLDFGDAFSFF